MKIFLVARGSQGSIYSYLTITSVLTERGHQATLNFLQTFEKEVKAYQLDYVLQDSDDIQEVVSKTGERSERAEPYLKWTRDVVGIQFKQPIPLLEEHDILTATNSEFAATSVADYCQKPFIRTTFTLFTFGRHIPPPIFPYPKPHPIFTPRFIWKLLNIGNNYMTQKTTSKNREQLGLRPSKNCGYYSTEGVFSYMLYNRYLGNTDPDQKYKWDIGGYYFNGVLHYDTDAYQQFPDFAQREQRPVISFTPGSCSARGSDASCNQLIHICRQLNFRLIVGSGWSGTRRSLANDKGIFLLTHIIPYSPVFPHCDTVTHHGGSGTTHSVARAGKPQVIIPLIIGQPYWAYRIQQLGTGPKCIKINKISDRELRGKVNGLVTNSVYKTEIMELAGQACEERSVDNFCDSVKSVVDQI